METEAEANGRYELPAAYADAMILARNGQWNYLTLRSTPHWLLERVRFIWHLDTLCEKKAKRDQDIQARAMNRHGK